MTLDTTPPDTSTPPDMSMPADTTPSPYLATAYENDRAHVFHSWSAQGALAPS